MSATTTFGLAAFSAFPSLAPVAVRTQLVLLEVNQIVEDDCEGLFSEEMLEEVPDVVSSPMQLYISSYPMGLIVGDFILIFVLTLIWVCFYYLVENYLIPYFRKTQSRNRIPSLFSKQFISKSKVMIPLVNFARMFVDPMFNSSIALLAIKNVGIGWKILGALISIVILLCGFFFFIIFYKLLYSRTVIEKFRKFRPYQQKRTENHLVAIWYMLMEPEGEWRSLRVGKRLDEFKSKESNATNKKNKKNIKNNNHNNLIVNEDDVFLWRICEPIIDGYTARFPRFVVVDILTILELSLATIIGNAAGNCLILGVLMLVPLFIHFFLLVFYRPDQQLLLRILNPIVDSLQIILVICALAKVDGSGIEAVAFILLILQMILFVLTLVSLALTLVEFVRGNFFQPKDEARNKKNLNSLSQVMKKRNEQDLTNRKRSNEIKKRNQEPRESTRNNESSHSNERSRRNSNDENEQDESSRRRVESARGFQNQNRSEEMKKRDDLTKLIEKDKVKRKHGNKNWNNDANKSTKYRRCVREKDLVQEDFMM